MKNSILLTLLLVGLTAHAAVIPTHGSMDSTFPKTLQEMKAIVSSAALSEYLNAGGDNPITGIDRMSSTNYSVKANQRCASVDVSYASSAESKPLLKITPEICYSNEDTKRKTSGTAKYDREVKEILLVLSSQKLANQFHAHPKASIFSLQIDDDSESRDYSISGMEISDGYEYMSVCALAQIMSVTEKLNWVPAACYKGGASVGN